jgi:Trypsin
VRISIVLIALISVACGRGPSAVETGATEAAVIGGTPAVMGDEISRSVVQLREKGSNSRELCTGVLISKTKVLTAAHCILVLRADRQNLEYRENFEIVFDVDAMTTDRARVRGVKEIFTHSDFEPDYQRCKLNPSIDGCALFLRTPLDKKRPEVDAAIIVLDRPAPKGTVPLKVFQGKPPLVFDAIVTGAGFRVPADSIKKLTIDVARSTSGRLDSYAQQIVLTSNPFKGRVRNAWGFSNKLFKIEGASGRKTEKGDSGSPLLIRTENGLQIYGVLQGGKDQADMIDGRTVEAQITYTDLTRDNWVNMNAN